MAEYTALAPLFTDIANAIRSKTGETGAITANNFPQEINAISIGTNTSDATATSAQILSGYTAYAKGNKLTRTLIQNKPTYTATTKTGYNSRGYFDFSGLATNSPTIICFAFYCAQETSMNRAPIVGGIYSGNSGILSYINSFSNSSLTTRSSAFSITIRKVETNYNNFQIQVFENISTSGLNWYGYYQSVLIYQ